GEPVVKDDPRRLRQCAPRRGQRRLLTDDPAVAVKLRECYRDVPQIVRYLLGLLRLCRSLQDLREEQQLLDQGNFGLVPEKRQVGILLEGKADLFGFPQDRADARVRVLQIKDGVLFAGLFREVEVELEVRVRRAHQEEEPGHVFANLVHQLVERNVVRLTRAHFDRLSAPDERDELVDDDV